MVNPYADIDIEEFNLELDDIARKERESMTEHEFEDMMNKMASEYETQLHVAFSYDEDASNSGENE